MSQSLLDFNLKVMRTAGLWPLDSRRKPLLAAYWLYTALLVVSISACSFCQILEVFYSPDIVSMACTVDLATLTASALFKQVYILYYQKHFQRLVGRIHSTFQESDFSLGTFRMAEWVKNTKMIITFYVLVPILVPIEGGYPPYFLADYFKRYQNFNVTTGTFEFSKQRMLPLRMAIPFDASLTPLYEVFYVFQCLTVYASGHVYLAVDAFFFMIIYSLCGQLELLNASYLGLGEKLKTPLTEDSCINGNEKFNNALMAQEKEMETEINNELTKYIDFHNTLIEIIKDLDRLFRAMVVADFVHAVLSLSFATLQLFVSNSFFEWHQMGVFIAVSIMHQFLNNYMGEMLTQKQMSVAGAVYEMPWVEGTKLQRTTVYMTITQANHPTRLSGWRMYHLGLETFVEFMKLLVSYVFVLNTLSKERHNGSH